MLKLFPAVISSACCAVRGCPLNPRFFASKYVKPYCLSIYLPRQLSIPQQLFVNLKPNLKSNLKPLDVFKPFTTLGKNVVATTLTLASLLFSPAVFSAGANFASASQPVNQSLNQSLSQPSLYAILMAEFAADRGRIDQALATYKQQSFLADAAPVFERALGLSLQNEPPQLSLAFANAWQQQNPDHVPAIFYVTHLALKAHEYELAGEKLNQILQYDPDADLSQILLGIYPTETRDQAELLATLNRLDIKNNPSLLVMKAGLLLQFQQPKAALVAINRALKTNPKSPAFLILKADILQALSPSNQVIAFIAQARKTVPDNKALFVYQIRYMLKQGKSAQVWQQLNARANQQFLADEEIKLLAALVGIDLKKYAAADRLLKALLASPNFKDQANYYLAVSAERQNLLMMRLATMAK